MTRALVLAAHGSHLDPNASAPIHAHAERVASLGQFDEVRAVFWKEEPSFARAFDGLCAEDVTVVPVFISDGYFVQDVLPRELRLTGRLSCVDGRCVRYTPPVGSHPTLARVVLQRAWEAGATGDEGLAVLGHGTPRNATSEANVYLQAQFVDEYRAFPEVAAVFLEQEPNMRDVFALFAAPAVVLVPLFVADGWHVGSSIPAELALAGAELRSGGRRLRYAAAAGTHPAVADVILDLAEEAAAW
ncbi:MAG: hypothetical protein IT304_01705 [Dehalococcoidia bacterium]|nr:hypothetical protein [Dehalococcoidia bacterium]